MCYISGIKWQHIYKQIKNKKKTINDFEANPFVWIINESLIIVYNKGNVTIVL